MAQTTKPIVITYETYSKHPGLKRLTDSLDKWGWENKYLLDPVWRGFGRKLKTISEKCKQLIGKYTHAISIDSRDVIATGPISDFKAPISPLLLSSEKACWPSKELEPLYPTCSHPWRFAHSPFTLDLNYINLLKADNIDDWEDDQLHLSKLFLEDNENIKIDHNGDIVQSIAFCNPWKEWFKYEGDRLVNITTRSKCLFAHGNGGTDMSWIKL